MTSKGFSTETVEKQHGVVCRVGMRIDSAVKFQ